MVIMVATIGMMVGEREVMVMVPMMMMRLGASDYSDSEMNVSLGMTIITLEMVLMVPVMRRKRRKTMTGEMSQR